MLWTSQGGLLSSFSEQIAQLECRPPSRITSELSNLFAFWFLLIECIAKSGLSGLQLLNTKGVVDISISWSFLIFAVLALIATLVVAFSISVEDSHQTAISRTDPMGKALAAVRIWRDPKIWLLSFTNLAFGFSSSFLNGYVNANYEKEALSKVLQNPADLLGFVGAIIALFAGLSANSFGSSTFFRIFGKKSKFATIFIGSSCFFAIGALSQVTYPNDEGPGAWGWGIFLFYVLQGVGRGVYEGTNKGIFADYFPGAQSTGAFANVMMQATLSSVVGYMFNQTSNHHGPSMAEIYLLLGCAMAALPCLLFAGHVLKWQDALK